MQKELYINGKFLSQQQTGVQVFATNICIELLENKIAFTLLVPSNHNAPKALKQSLKKIGSLTGILWEQISLPNFIQKQSNALLLNLCNSAPLFGNPQVVTIHDLAFMHNPKWFNPMMSKWYNFLIPRIVKNAASVVTVSNTVKKEIAHYLGVKEAKINVIANKPTTTSTELEKVSIPFKQYFLIIGSDNPRKNIGFVASTLANTAFNLVVVGGASHHFGKTEKITAKNIHYTGYLSQEQLNWVYQNCTAVISASLYEGFGIPLLDAFQHKKPLICSNIPVFKEVAKMGALFFNPTNKKELLQILESKLYANPALIQQGEIQLQHYITMNRASQIKQLVSNNRVATSV